MEVKSKYRMRNILNTISEEKNIIRQKVREISTMNKQMEKNNGIECSKYGRGKNFSIE